MRSRAAASILEGAGFSRVFNLEGGIRAWNGLMAHGAPETGIVHFQTLKSDEERIAMAWLMEEGARVFYDAVARDSSDNEAKDLFLQLVTAEEHHKDSLMELYRKLTGKEPESGFPHSVLSGSGPEGLMESGLLVSDAVKWAEGKDLMGLIELSISFEADSLDLYHKLFNTADDENSKGIFGHLINEEKGHLDKLAELLESKLN